MGDKVRVYFEVGTYQHSCATILPKLHDVYNKLQPVFPDEFKNTRPPVVAPVDNPADDSDEENKQPAAAAAPESEQDQALLLMQNEDIGWKLVAMLGWRDKEDGGGMTAQQVKKIIANADEMPESIGIRGGPWHPRAVVQALYYWMEQFADRAARVCAGWDKNSVYQMVAHGKEMFDVALTTPDIRTYLQHQQQDLDLPKILDRATRKKH